jgi:glucose-6-phosphate isomerase
VLHTALRNQSDDSILVDGVNVMPKIRTVLAKMRKFSEQVRKGEWRGCTGKPITDIVNIGIGGSDLGPKMVTHALAYYAQENLHCHFVSNVDGTQIVQTLKSLNPETTLFIIASKTFTTLETLTNAKAAKEWLLQKLNVSLDAVAKHFVAVSTNAQQVAAFGIDPENMFEFWDWVGGRYSVWSAIGLPVVLAIGMDNFMEFLTGAYAMDQHFRQAEFANNMPVILALLGVWYRNFFAVGTQAIIPYSQYLFYLTAYLQQLDMESNGKSVTITGEVVDYNTGAIIWGGIGTDGQHAYHQLLHQGTEIIPVDFILPINSLNPIGEQHKLLYANCLAQSQALSLGRFVDEIYPELIDKGMATDEAGILALHKAMPGNQPSNTLLFEKLTPRSLGALIALYEHKVFVQGMIWEIDSFDQWGVELGKQLANEIVGDLAGEEYSKQYAEYDNSTQGLIKYYRDLAK